VEAIGIDEIDRGHSVIRLKSSSRFGVRQFAIDFIRQDSCRILIDVVYRDGEMRDYALFLSR